MKIWKPFTISLLPLRSARLESLPAVKCPVLHRVVFNFNVERQWRISLIQLFFATKTGIALLLRHQNISKILVLIHSYFTQKNWSLLKNSVEELIEKKNRLRRRRDQNLIQYLNTCNRQEGKCMFPFYFPFQLSKDVRTRLEINKCRIPWICCVLILRSMKVDRSATNFWWACLVHRACLY